MPSGDRISVEYWRWLRRPSELTLVLMVTGHRPGDSYLVHAIAIDTDAEDPLVVFEAEVPLPESVALFDVPVKTTDLADASYRLQVFIGGSLLGEYPFSVDGGRGEPGRAPGG